MPKLQFEEMTVSVADLVKGYEEMGIDGDEGVIGFSGNLNIRPPYQREFVYTPSEARAVIESILDDCPLNAMYWMDKGDEKYEVLDGQQRSISVGRFLSDDLAIFNSSGKKELFSQLDIGVRNKILNYPLNVIKCYGSWEEQLKWFKTINIAGKALMTQEIRNAVHLCDWVEDARNYFGKENCIAKRKWGKYLSGAYRRQVVLEKFIVWASNGKPDTLMLHHKENKTPNASGLKNYAKNVMKWVEATFVEDKNKIPPEMRKVEWGELYDKFRNDPRSPKELQEEVHKIWKKFEAKAEDPNNVVRSMVYRYVLDPDRKQEWMYKRGFAKEDKQRKWHEQQGSCYNCGEPLALEQLQGDHIKPISKDGPTSRSNLQLLCKKCNLDKGAKIE